MYIVIRQTHAVKKNVSFISAQKRVRKKTQQSLTTAIAAKNRPAHTACNSIILCDEHRCQRNDIRTMRAGKRNERDEKIGASEKLVGIRVVHGSILCDPIQPNPSAD